MPAISNTLHQDGITAFQNDDLPAALDCLRRAAQSADGDAAIQGDLAVVLHRAGEWNEADAHFVKALLLDPDNARFHYNFGLLLGDMDKAQDAEARYREAIMLDPGFAPAHNNLGNLLKSQKKMTGAMDCYRQSITADPTYAPALKNLADAEETLGDAAQAVEHYAQAIHLRADAGTMIRDAILLPMIPDSIDQVAEYRRRMIDKIAQLMDQKITLRDPLGEVGATNFLASYHGLDDRSLQVDLAQLYLSACPDLSFIAPHCGNWMAGLEGGKIRIGFVSTFFRDHTIGRLNLGLIAGLSRSEFEIYVYRFDQPADGMGRRIEDGADVQRVLPRNLDSARARIAEDELDILYYPDIGMEPITYFLGFARLAPIQCVAWGHPVTTGIPNIDYFISSRLIEPDGAAAAYSEKLVQLDSLPVCIEPPSEEGIDRQGKNGGPLFVCPQSLFKLHPDFDTLIIRILTEDRAARLCLLDGAFSVWNERLMKRISAKSPGMADRISFAPRTDRAGFLTLLKSADIILDTPHFSGGMTTFESLAVGTPVVTLPGEFMRGRVSLGLYRQMQIDDCVADTSDDYVALANRLARDRIFAAETREKIIQQKDRIFNNRQTIRQHAKFFEKAMYETVR